MNKYARSPSQIIDLHKHTRQEAKQVLDNLFEQRKHSHIRIITGKGVHSSNGSVLKDFVKNYLNKQTASFSQSKIQDGGEGAVEVYL